MTRARAVVVFASGIVLAVAGIGCTNPVGQALGYIECLAAGTTINLTTGSPLESAEKCTDSTPQQEPQGTTGLAATCAGCLNASCNAPSQTCVDDETCLCLVYCIGGRNSEADCTAACKVAPNNATRAELGCIADNCAADCPGFAP